MKRTFVLIMLVFFFCAGCGCNETTRIVKVDDSGNNKSVADNQNETTNNAPSVKVDPFAEKPFPKAEPVKEWFMFKGTPDNLGLVDADIKLPLGKKYDEKNKKAVEYRWVSFSAPNMNRLLGNPAVVRNRIYFGCEMGFISCFDFITGEPKWRNGDQIKPIITPIAANDYVVVFGTLDGEVYCYDGLSDSKLWVFKTDPNISAPPNITDENVKNGRVHGGPKIVDDKVYFGAFDGKLYCLNIKDGKKVWEFATKGKIYSSPAISDGRIYFANFEGKLFCIDQKTGKKIWDADLGKPTIASPVVFGPRVWIGGKNSKMFCFQTKDGKKLWEYQGPISDYGIESTPALDEENLYFGETKGGLICLNWKTGKEVYKVSISDKPLNSSPVIVRNMVMIGGHDKNFYVIDKKNGKVLDTFTTRGSILASPIIIGNEVLVTSYDSSIYILRAKGTNPP